MTTTDVRFAHLTYEMALQFPAIVRRLSFWWELPPIMLVPLPGRAYDPEAFVTLAIDQSGDIIGFHVFALRAAEIDVEEVRSQLTYVVKAHRRRGLAQQLWRETLRWTGAQQASLYVASKAGDALATALVDRLPHVSIYVS